MSTKFEMGPIQRDWVAQLRSGKYKQGPYFLHIISSSGDLKHSFCCLGVFAHQHHETKAVTVKDKCQIIEYDNETGALSYKLVEKLKINNNRGRFIHPTHGDTSLTSLNDKNHSFEEIADIIEKYAHLIFTEPA